ncbi:RNA polymerase sigma factor [Thalassotalea psychrophila]|uniref:RNA polymerase sigma factor n=1 Tax=Thalassotalea psychrophila TaxID=3065647 RepID=A0ABY9TUK3_9GAMM|nr:RNA polymerase sigma factor [Colwelliaceae bacterium SQ149]
MDKEVKLSDIFMGYRGRIRQIISRIVKRDDIDDIVQETFIRTYQADLKKEIKYVRSYMLTTAKNLALNHIAKWDNKFNDSLEDFTESPVELNSRPFEENFESKERFLLFCRAIEQLPSSVRKCFVLKKVYGFSQKEIALYLQLSESTVEKHIAKGLLKSVQFMERMDLISGRSTEEKDLSKASKGKKKRVIK